MVRRFADNGCIGAGGVARDAEYKTVGQNNTPCTRFSFRYGVDANNQALYANCVAWYELAHIAAQIRKGDYVFVAGRYEEYQGNDGKTYKSIVCDYVGVNKPVQAQQQQTVQPAIPEGFSEANNDDLPF